jgi:hypothetical protein
MRRLVHHLLGGIPVSPAATRAIVATMADWRHEAEAASSKARRVWAFLRGVASVARVLGGVGLQELPTAWLSPFVWRTAVYGVLVLCGLVLTSPPVRFADVLDGWHLAVLATASAAPTAIALLPLAAFLSESTGRQSRSAPSVGAFALMALCLAVAVAVIPELMTYERHVSWSHFANAATPPPLPLPSLYRLFVDGPSVPMTVAWGVRFGSVYIVLVLATAGLSTLAYQVRQRRGLRAWLIGVTPFLAVFVSVYAVMLVSGLVALAWRDVMFWTWPVRGLVFVASVTVLPLILAAHLARDTSRRVNTSDSEVTA